MLNLTRMRKHDFPIHHKGVRVLCLLEVQNIFMSTQMAKQRKISEFTFGYLRHEEIFSFPISNQVEVLHVCM